MSGELWQSGSDAVRACVLDGLFRKAVASSAPRTINLFDELRSILVSSGAPATLAEERAEKWLANLIDLTEEHLAEWDQQGLPRPFQWLNQRRTCVTWTHPQFEAITGLPPLPARFADVYDWVLSLREAELLLAGVCVAETLGAKPILIVDGKGDGGIDVIARITNGPLRSTLLVMQSKTQLEGPITRQTVLSEYGKYAISRRNGVIREYMRAANLHATPDGCSIAYIFLANTEFDVGARDAARELGVLLRSARQIAHCLCTRTTRQRLANALNAMRPQLRRDLSRDYSVDVGGRL